mmetsp:Transcript_118/g.124  ORF Transcript_118/g.124 Transcript_118/m.124 type:complete len:241 (+) Transcript_118:119-841(+)
MEDFFSLNLAEQLSIAICPDGLVFLGTKKCFLVACTGKFSPQKSLPTSEDKLEVIIVFSEECPDDLNEFRPVDEDHWEYFRDHFNAAVPGTFSASQTFEGMLLETVKVFLDHRERYEGMSFPLSFPKGIGTYGGSKRCPNISFKDYYYDEYLGGRAVFKDHRYDCWCKLMVQGLQVFVKNGALEDRRVLPLLSKTCAVCGTTHEQDVKRCSKCHVVCYCSRAHQIEDWGVHKAECKKMRN